MSDIPPLPVSDLAELPELPGGPMATRPLHFVFICDTSYSMMGEKIASLNHAVREALPHMVDVAKSNPNARLLLRSLAFSTGARWTVSQPTEVEAFSWVDLAADGQTDMGRAMNLVTDILKMPPMNERALPPVLVLITDGQPTDTRAFNDGLAALMAEPWGKKSVRLGIAIGHDADLDVLRRFIGNPELEPLLANNSADLVRYIRWASTAVVQAASAPPSQTAGSAPAGLGPVPLPPPPAPSAPPSSTSDVW